MSMPVISLPPLDRTDAVNSLLASIALEEAALSHLINAQGETIQAVLQLKPALPDLLRLNAGVEEILRCAAQTEDCLRAKLTRVLQTAEPAVTPPIPQP